MTRNTHPSGAPWRNFYGRGKGKTLRESQKSYLDEDLVALSPGPVDWDENPDRAPLDLEALFDGKPVWLEIGFGGGEHLVHQAALHPEVGIIGCEPFINGVAMLLGKIRDAGVGQRCRASRRCARSVRCAARRLASTRRSCSIPIPGRRSAITAAAS